MQRENSSLRLMRITRFCAARAIAFSIAASPAPTTTIVSSSYSFGSSSWYWTTGRSSPLTPSLRRLPWRPIASTTCAAFDRVAARELERERALLPADRGDPGALAQVDLVLREALRPTPPRTCSRVAAANDEGTAQRQDRRLRHHVLALLVLVDRVGGMALGFEQDVRDAELGRVRGGREPGRAGADDCDLVDVRHGTQPCLLHRPSFPRTREPSDYCRSYPDQRHWVSAFAGTTLSTCGAAFRAPVGMS